jgi:uncharacterized SAM-binding protein YcdF (DUF218 family)
MGLLGDDREARKYSKGAFGATPRRASRREKASLLLAWMSASTTECSEVFCKKERPMTKEIALQTIWDYMLVDHTLKKADVIFAHVARELGVPDEDILIENQSQNTGENFAFTLNLLADNGIVPKRIIAVQKPYMERRTYATGKVHLPESIEFIVTSPPILMQDYPNQYNSVGDHWIHAMVGDLQRIKRYPALGFQIPQEIPDEVWKAYLYLVDLGYTNRLIKD